MSDVSGGISLEISPGVGLEITPGVGLLLRGGDFTDPYGFLNLITSEHRVRPNFMAAVIASIAPFSDIIGVALGVPGGFDLDTAVGVQLDATGLWIGLSRRVLVPITDVYFSFDIVGVGFDEGIWFTEGDDISSVEYMDDETYRAALKCKAAMNVWDGSVDAAYAALNPFVAPAEITITDNEDMTITATITGSVPAIVLAILQQQLICFRPAGVKQNGP